MSLGAKHQVLAIEPGAKLVTREDGIGKLYWIMAGGVRLSDTHASAVTAWQHALGNLQHAKAGAA
jgi:hypothetical protein